MSIKELTIKKLQLREKTSRYISTKYLSYMSKYLLTTLATP